MHCEGGGGEGGGGGGGVVQTNTVDVMITMWIQMLELFDWPLAPEQNVAKIST